MHQQEISHLLSKVQSGAATPEEEDIVKLWLHQLNQNGSPQLSDRDLFSARKLMWTKIRHKSHLFGSPKVTWQKLTVAASIICISIFGTYFLYSKFGVKNIVQNKLSEKSILPGNNKAILTLSDGRNISLADASNGILAVQENAAINKSADGVIAYLAKPLEQYDGKTYNTMQTPKGGQYTLMLSDGTKVILNAASRITYPVSFKGAKRRVVKLIGEAYFEVSHDKMVPFHVESKGLDIEVLGTHFNVNTYPDEPTIQTTLLEGSVKINGTTILKPGQQAVLSSDVIKVRNVNTNEFAAWKDGLFEFNNANIQSVMRQLARWYDVEVVYEGEMPNTVINGEVYRNMNADKVLEVLKNLKIHFRIEGRKIYVTK